MNDLLKDQVCLVTGAARGIGKAVALSMAQQGGIVWGTATSEDGAETIEISLKENGLQGYGRVLDVRDADAISDLVTEITDQTGAPLRLVNNAGVTRDNLLMRMKQDEWDDVIQTNLKSIYLLSKTCLRAMTKARDGRIINIASIVGISGNAGQCNYAAAKAGIMGFSKSLAREVALRGVTVNTIAPGFIDTDMTRALDEAQFKSVLEKVPMGRMGQANEVADAVVFLASDMASYITGSTVNVNGGMLMM